MESACCHTETEDEARQAVWRHLRLVLATLIADIEAVLRVQLGGPPLRLRPIAEGETGADLWIGPTRLRLVLEEPDEPPPFALSSSPRALYLRIVSIGRGAGPEGLWIDPTNRRWLTSAVPTEAYGLDDASALDGYFLSLIAA